MVYVVLEKIILGGAETLFFRIGEWFSDSKKYTIISNDIDELALEFLEDRKISYKIVNCNALKYLSNRVAKDDTVICVSLKNKLLWKLFFKDKCKCVLYVLHPYIFDIRRFEKFGVIQDCIRKIIRRYIEQEIIKHNIIFMDDMCLQRLRNNYCIDKDYPNAIFSLPYTESNEEYNSYREDMFNSNRILLIARADFPFKGYILGTINRAEEILNINDKINILIISYGEGEGEIEKCLEKLPQNIRARIVLKGETPYNKLPYYYKSSKMFLGMGSTIVESAKYGLPAYVVKSYTKELIINKKIFFNDPLCLCKLDFKETASCSKSLDCIEKIMSLEKEEYYALGNEMQKAFKANYLIDSIMCRMASYCDF